ncbi:hypothetical protein [Candidatus Odyssella thessalonicensis]|uniref:hypothetical protein n=1 Tax=Candidatus Odyssella thessalonicensis TaxID=84647 RepID=UPI000225ACDB|nr:hypothetical protein [Candidatus Odyssella thessalonicensis]
MNLELETQGGFRDRAREIGVRSFVFLQKHEAVVEKLVSFNRSFFYVTVGLMVALSMIDCADAITVQSLKAPIQELKKEIFGGWMFVVQIISAVGGIVISVIAQSLKPLGWGGATAVTAHFYDKYIGDGKSGLI